MSYFNGIPSNGTSLSLSEKYLADTVLVDTLKVQAGWQQSVTILNHDSWLMIAGPTDYPTPIRNLAIRQGPSISAEEFLQHACDFFFPLKRAFSIICRDEETDLQTVLMKFSARSLGRQCRMFCGQPFLRDSYPALQTQKMQTAETLESLIRVSERAFSYPDGEVRASFSNERAVLNKSVIGRIGYEGSNPVTCGLAVCYQTTAIIDWVATVKEARGKGFAKECINQLCVDCFDNGCNTIFLTSTASGLNLYHHLGFRVFSYLHTYLVTP